MAVRKNYHLYIVLLIALMLWPASESSAGVTIAYESRGVFDFNEAIDRVLGRAESYLRATAAKDAEGNQLSVWPSVSATLDYLEPKLGQSSDVELQTAVAILAWLVSHQKGQHRMEQIVRLNQTYAIGHCFLAIFALREKDLAGYGRHFEEAIQADPNYLPAYNSLLLYYGQVGKRDAALDLLARGNARFPNESSLFYNLGLSYAREENWKDAQLNLRHAVARQSTEQNRLALGLVYLLGQQYISAQNVFESILETNPKHILALAGLAESYKGRHDFKKAIALIEQAIAIEPTNKDLKDELRMHQEAAEQWKRQGNAHEVK